MYSFRREDNGEIVTVDFETMMTKDSLGFITLADGTQAREIRESSVTREKAGAASTVNRPILSDALGFPQQCLADFEADRQANGFSGVEFVRDKHVPEFIQAKCSNPREWQRYIKHRGALDRNSLNGGGATLSSYQLARTAEMVAREHPPNDNADASLPLTKKSADTND